MDLKRPGLQPAACVAGLLLLSSCVAEPVPAIGPAVASPDGTQAMNQDQGSKRMALVYGAELADLFGLPAQHAVDIGAPLLGAALEIDRGPRGGHLCRVHALVRSDAGLRLPAEDSLSLIAAGRSNAPFAFVRKPAKTMRKSLARVANALSNRAILRLSDAPIGGRVKISDDDEATYTSMPLDAFEREFVPGVDWFSMSFGCALLATQKYRQHVLWVERDDGEPDRILNLDLDPAQMVGLNIPRVLFDSMQPAVQAAQAADDADYPSTPPEPVFDVVTSDGKLIAP